MKLHQTSFTTRGSGYLLRASAVSAALLLAIATGNTQTQVFSEDFQTDHSSDSTWIINTVGGYNPVDLYFDYSTVGIPPAPHSTGGTTRGLKLQANLDSAVGVFPSGCSVSPAGFSITENFEMRWDWWLNFNGSATTGLTGGGSGSTQIGGAGFGTAATAANVPTQIDAIFVGCSGDGTGTTADYRVYSPAFSASLQDASGVYAAGTVGSRNNTHAYYQSTFPPVSATNTCPDQLAMFPAQQFGLTQGGSAGMKWHDISLRKVANIITYTVDGLLIATIDASTNGTLGGANIVFGHFDINATVSTDPNAPALAFSLVDNVRITNFATVVAVTAVQSEASETGPTPGIFRLTRTALGAPLTVNYTMGGTATSGDDYVALPGSVTFGANADSVDITLTPVDDAIAEPTETAVLTITDSPNFQHGGPATVTIADNEPPQLTIASVNSQLFERTNDYAAFRITRLGQLNAVLLNINLTFAGTAANGIDFYAEDPGTMDWGQLTKDIKVYPIADNLYEGHETITVNLAPSTGGDYTVGSPSSATVTLVDATSPPETELFRDDFNTDTSANWDLFATGGDYSATFLFDYSALGIPPAPHSTGDTLGLRLAVNKSTGAATALNLYPRGKSFSGNYALRFDMFLNAVVPSTVSTEYALFGINHSGARTNWFRNSPGGIAADWTFDGLFFGLEADGAGLGDYAIYSSPTVANNPTLLVPARVVTTLTDVFKSPPNSVAGVPSNDASRGTPIWADVEVSQIGNVVTLRVNNTPILSYSNATTYASGNIMIGYDDAYDSVSLDTSYMVIDNVRVVRLQGLNIVSVRDLGADVQLDFDFDLTDSPEGFKVLAAAVVAGPYADAGGTVAQLSPGHYRAAVPKNGNAQFYRIARN
ncbi:MAG TPA: Calx-beta domain-containing protein [Verrucomicrobiae bacterium]